MQGDVGAKKMALLFGIVNAGREFTGGGQVLVKIYS